MVNLRHCHARLDSERDVRCDLKITQNQSFCPAHDTEYEALKARGNAAEAILQEAGGSIELLNAIDVNSYTTYEAIQRDLEDLQRYLLELDERIDTRKRLSRRFFTEPEKCAAEAVADLERRKTNVVATLARFRARSLAIREDARREVQEDREEDEGHPEETVRRDVFEVPPGAVEAVCNEDPEPVPGPGRETTPDEDAATPSDQSPAPEGAPGQVSPPSHDGETPEEAERRREQVKHRIKVLNEYKRKKAEEAKTTKEESPEPPRTAVAPASSGGSGGDGLSGLEVAGRVALTVAVVGIALFMGVRNVDTIRRLGGRCMGKE